MSIYFYSSHINLCSWISYFSYFFDETNGTKMALNCFVNFENRVCDDRKSTVAEVWGGWCNGITSQETEEDDRSVYVSLARTRVLGCLICIKRNSICYWIWPYKESGSLTWLPNHVTSSVGQRWRYLSMYTRTCRLSAWVACWSK